MFVDELCTLKRVEGKKECSIVEYNTIQYNAMQLRFILTALESSKVHEINIIKPALYVTLQ